MEKRKAQEQSTQREGRSRSRSSTAWVVEGKPKVPGVRKASDAHGSGRRERSRRSDAAGYGPDKVRTESCPSDSKPEGRW